MVGKIVKGKDLVVPRRQHTRMTKADVKLIAKEILSNYLEVSMASKLMDAFSLVVSRKKHRFPSEGEKELFMGVLSEIIEKLNKHPKQPKK